MEYDISSQPLNTQEPSSTSLISRAHRDTMELVEKADIPLIVKHFAALRTEYRALKDKI